jgi:hypothetical protein
MSSLADVRDEVNSVELSVSREAFLSGVFCCTEFHAVLPASEPFKEATLCLALSKVEISQENACSKHLSTVCLNKAPESLLLEEVASQ